MKRDNVIVFDLDETILSTSLRQYNVIKSFFQKNDLVINYTYQQYLKLREDQQISNLQFFRLNQFVEQHISSFQIFYLEHIESSFFLGFDTLLTELDYLKKLSIKYNCNLVILSLRSNEKNSNEQMNTLGLDKIFDSFYFMKHSNKNNPKVKVLNELSLKYNLLYFIGDSKSDYESASESNTKFIKVNTNIYKFSYNGQQYSHINEYLKIENDNNDTV